MACFGIAFEHTMVPRWLRTLCASTHGSDDLTDWDYSPDNTHRRPHLPPLNMNVQASSSQQAERNDTKIFLDTESSSRGDRPNSPDWTDRKISQIPTLQNPPQAPDSAYLACAPARTQMPALPEIRKDQPLPAASFSRSRPKGMGDPRTVSTRSKYFLVILKTY